MPENLITVQKAQEVQKRTEYETKYRRSNFLNNNDSLL